MLGPLKKQDSAAIRANHSPQNNNLNILTPLSSGLSNQPNPLYTSKNVVAGQKHVRGNSVDAGGNPSDHIRNKMQSIVKGREHSVRISRINGDELQHNSVIEYSDKNKGIAGDLESLSINGKHNQSIQESSQVRKSL